MKQTLEITYETKDDSDEASYRIHAESPILVDEEEFTDAVATARLAQFSVEHPDPALWFAFYHWLLTKITPGVFRQLQNAVAHKVQTGERPERVNHIFSMLVDEFLNSQGGFVAGIICEAAQRAPTLGIVPETDDGIDWTGIPPFDGKAQANEG